MSSGLEQKGIGSESRLSHKASVESGSILGTGVIWEFPKLGVPYFGVLMIRILLFRVLY